MTGTVTLGGTVETDGQQADFGAIILEFLAKAVAGQAGIWGDFIRNSRTHLSTPLANHVGLAILQARNKQGDTVKAFVKETNELAKALGMKPNGPPLFDPTP